VSSLATYSWKSFRLRRTVRFEAIAVAVVLAAALVTAPWQTMTIVAAVYLISMPFSMLSYRRIRQRGAGERLREPASPPIA
jgi:CDP-diacylglycerol--serine O-phosphatidyltransferase